jgi:2-C-methyl-D-erythritol 4-phosphate cytidylyltransferase
VGFLVPRFAVILPAAGKSSRFRDQHYKKPFAPLDGRPVWMHAAEKLANRKDVIQSLLVISPEDRDDFAEKFGGNAALLGIEIVEGGAERSDSVNKALERLNPEAEYVAIHDAARPCIVDE